MVFDCSLMKRKTPPEASSEGVDGLETPPVWFCSGVGCSHLGGCRLGKREALRRQVRVVPLAAHHHGWPDEEAHVEDHDRQVDPAPLLFEVGLIQDDRRGDGHVG